MTKDYSQIDLLVNQNIEKLNKRLTSSYCGLTAEIDRAILQSLQKDSFRTLYDLISYRPLSNNEGLTVTKNSLLINNKAAIKSSLDKILFHFLYLLGSTLVILTQIIKVFPKTSTNRGNKKFCFVDINLNSTSPVLKPKDNFLEFCSSGKVPLLNDDNNLFFISTNEEFVKENYFFTSKRLLLSPIENNLLKRSELLKLAFTSIRVLFRNLWLSLKDPNLSVISHHLGWIAIIEFYNSQQLISHYLVTNTNLLYQPIWFNELPNGDKRAFKSHMLFYSTNNKGLRLKGLSRPNEPFPYFKFIKCDEAWVWTKEDKAWIENFTNISRVNIVGSILFYPPAISKQGQIKDNKVIGVFDVPIFNETTLKTVTHENLLMYNSSDTVLLFLNDILKISEDLNLKMCLKVKRGVKPDIYSSEYIEFIEKIKAAPLHEVHSENINLYKFISNCDAVITLPFTSPFYVAKEQGIPAIFYDPSEIVEEMPYYQGDVVYDKQALFHFLNKAISN